MSTIFVSHTASDKEIVEAFSTAVQGLLGEKVDLKISSSPEHGPRPGEQWLTWIHEQVKESLFAIVFITPFSASKPWILWEAGAVTGASLAAGQQDLRRVRPIIYRLKTEQVPDPFKDTQFVLGDDRDSMYNMFEEWITSVLNGTAIAKSVARLPNVLKAYLDAVNTALDNAPLLPTEPIVQEWTLRLDTLRRENRTSEVRTVHQWLNAAFGVQQESRPLDIRLHRRLGELYLSSQEYEMAAAQFELAREASPRDIFILRELGRAYLGAKRGDKVAEIVQAIQTFDPDAFKRNVECAALKGRWLRDSDPAAARDVYRDAFPLNPKSYYIGDLLGQMQLQLGQIDEAKNTYRRVLEIINSLSEQNLWTQATAANAAIVSGADPAIIKDKLRHIRDFNPSAENLRTVEDGLGRLQAPLNIESPIFAEWIAALRS